MVFLDHVGAGQRSAQILRVNRCFANHIIAIDASGEPLVCRPNQVVFKHRFLWIGEALQQHGGRLLRLGDDFPACIEHHRPVGIRLLVGPQIDVHVAHLIERTVGRMRRWQVDPSTVNRVPTLELVDACFLSIGVGGEQQFHAVVVKNGHPAHDRILRRIGIFKGQRVDTRNGLVAIGACGQNPVHRHLSRRGVAFNHHGRCRSIQRFQGVPRACIDVPLLHSIRRHPSVEACRFVPKQVRQEGALALADAREDGAYAFAGCVPRGRTIGIVASHGRHFVALDLFPRIGGWNDVVEHRVVEDGRDFCAAIGGALENLIAQILRLGLKLPKDVRLPIVDVHMGDGWGVAGGASKFKPGFVADVGVHPVRGDLTNPVNQGGCARTRHVGEGAAIRRVRHSGEQRPGRRHVVQPLNFEVPAG